MESTSLLHNRWSPAARLVTRIKESAAHASLESVPKGIKDWAPSLDRQSLRGESKGAILVPMAAAVWHVAGPRCDSHEWSHFDLSGLQRPPSSLSVGQCFECKHACGGTRKAVNYTPP